MKIAKRTQEAAALKPCPCPSVCVRGQGTHHFSQPRATPSPRRLRRAYDEVWRELGSLHKDAFKINRHGLLRADALYSRHRSAPYRTEPRRPLPARL